MLVKVTPEQRARRIAGSEAMRKSAAARTCPACKRRNALNRPKRIAHPRTYDGPPIPLTCRYCGHAGERDDLAAANG